MYMYLRDIIKDKYLNVKIKLQNIYIQVVKTAQLILKLVEMIKESIATLFF